jgi:hypothetical protein
MLSRIDPAYRNVAIILVLAGLVDVVPGGGEASSTALEAVYLAFFGAFVYVATRLYREHRSSIDGLGDRRRATAYVALGVIALTLTGTNALWNHGAGGNLAWLVLIGGSAFALFRVFRSTREY